MIVSKVRYLILLEGTATDRLTQAVEKANGKSIIAGRFDTMLQAVETAGKLASEGDVVLLSPGCASFGMFANEFERGDVFKRIVNSAG